MHYADSSFLVSLLILDDMTARVVDAYRSMGRPPFVFSQLHQMEVRNALRLNPFIQAGQLPVKQRATAALPWKRAELRLESLLQKKALVAKSADWTRIEGQFSSLSEAHTLKLGTRSLDILHVAFALELGCEVFVTCDQRQAGLAKAAGLKTTLVALNS